MIMINSCAIASVDVDTSNNELQDVTVGIMELLDVSTQNKKKLGPNGDLDDWHFDEHSDDEENDNSDGSSNKARNAP